ncbi:MAG: pyridoxal phosphate-dependent aminotransferase, partial [Chloroflexi bacterium]|nr:pyridoxal phosphate-dependent aminotransferase [Chloroflexota bacterium]
MSLDDLDLTLSPLEKLRREAARRDDYVDLSSSNPTHHGLIFPPDILRDAANAYWRTRRYEPHPKGSLCAREAIAQYYA